MGRIFFFLYGRGKREGVFLKLGDGDIKRSVSGDCRFQVKGAGWCGGDWLSGRICGWLVEEGSIGVEVEKVFWEEYFWNLGV